MIPDAFERTVRIPVQWIDGQWQLIGGGKLPELKPNVCAELSMPAIALAIDEERERWTAGETVVFLTAGTELLAQVNRNRVPGPLKEKALDKPHKTGHPSAYVPIELLTDVSLSLTPGKKAGLAGGRCRVASLNVEVGSINEALTRISREFEPDRKSFGGSVFLKVFVERDSRLISLDDLRDQRTSVAALDAARPRDRCDSWLELSVSLSRVSDSWNAHQQQLASGAVSQRMVSKPQAMPMPAGSDELLEKAASELFDFRTKALNHSDAGLIELMDCAVLNAYGWQDLALSARREFLLDYEEEGVASGEWSGASGKPAAHHPPHSTHHSPPQAAALAAALASPLARRVPRRSPRPTPRTQRTTTQKRRTACGKEGIRRREEKDENYGSDKEAVSGYRTTGVGIRSRRLTGLHIT